MGQLVTASAAQTHGGANRGGGDSCWRRACNVIEIGLVWRGGEGRGGIEAGGGRGCVSHTTLSVKRKEGERSLAAVSLPSAACRGMKREGTDGRSKMTGRLRARHECHHPSRPSCPPPSCLPQHPSPAAAGAPSMLTCSSNKKHPKLN